MSQEVTYEKTDGCLPCSSSGNDACERLWGQRKTAQHFILKTAESRRKYHGRFQTDNYDEKELKTFIEQQIEDYKKESGNSVKSVGLRQKKESINLTVKFDDTKTYSDFNDETLYQGSVVEAVADGYTFPEHFYPVKDGKLKRKQPIRISIDDDSYKVVITSESIDVAVSGKVAYVSGNNVKIKDEKTVSIQKENADDTSLTYIVYK